MTIPPRRVCIVTGGRSDYAFLRWLARAVQRSRHLSLFIVATGMHLQESSGLTIAEIERDGFTVNHAVPFFRRDASSRGALSDLGEALPHLGFALQSIDPDWVVLLGDRLEVLGAALAAHLYQIPVAHIHGGEVTRGSLDEAHRHAITKIASLHFPCTEVYRRRVIQLGEDPSRVFNVGALAVEGTLQSVATEAGGSVMDDHFLNGDSLLCTFHPVTTSEDYGVGDLSALLAVLGEAKHLRILFTSPNSDPGSDSIDLLIRSFVNQNQDRARLVTSLGQDSYLRALRICRGVVGNSSSSLLEGAILGTPALDVGSRQSGRLRTPNVVHATGHPDTIRQALDDVLSRSREVFPAHPFGDGGTSETMVRILAEAPLTIEKSFHDVSGP